MATANPNLAAFQLAKTQSASYQPRKFDVLFAGAGVVGLALARLLKQKHPTLRIGFLEKESEVAFHSSGRNSGVLHAGFYYTANSLKAQFTRDGNAALKKFCSQKNIHVNANEKLVVAQSEADIPGIHELYKRGQVNGVGVKVVSEKEAREIDPNVKTREVALYSPSTATVNPVEVCLALKNELLAKGVEFFFSEGFQQRVSDHETKTTLGRIMEHDLFINSAGLYADQIAKQYGFSEHYTIIPFKGIYLKFTKPDHPIRVNVYPVPNLKNPFLGVHFTITHDNHIKIGPTAIPAFWRENYNGLDRFNFREFTEILFHESDLFLKNSFNFRSLAFEEMRKYNKKYFVNLAAKMVHQLDQSGFTDWTKPGIRAQLLDKRNNALVQDFVVESGGKTVHVLNAVSPAFTSSFPFAEWIYTNHVKAKLAAQTKTAEVSPQPIF